MTIEKLLHSQKPHEKRLLLRSEDQRTVSAVLRDGWEEIPCRTGDAVNIVHFERRSACVDEASEYVIDHASPYLFVLHPNIFVPPSTVCLHVECSRMAVLKSNFRFKMDTSSTSGRESERGRMLAMLRGSMIHELYQSLLKSQSFQKKDFIDNLDQVVRKHVPDLWSLRCEEVKIFIEIMKKMDTLMKWARIYLSPSLRGGGAPAPCSSGDAPPHLRGGVRANEHIRITKIVDVEEGILSPIFGLKGSIDVTVMAENELGESGIFPLEFKSGMAQVVHRAQLSLYTFLLSDRYQRNIDRGFLLTFGGSLSFLLFPHRNPSECAPVRCGLSSCATHSFCRRENGNCGGFKGRCQRADDCSQYGRHI